ncbi:hypothetical protein [Antarcticirhabdus aurantiaca]|uniref:Uncharacterized protein n=1 Tax=Antarcticirhabdus aurantiaca TaxID=2606717 RepID=A0ACD4NLP7_9HYPH|nr:hypothetical protein OXU80_22500 [Jeongeuplla avenae]
MSAPRDTTVILQALAKLIDKHVAPHGFVLLMIAPDGTAEAGSSVNYVSNRNRDDIVVAMKEIVARFEGQANQRGSA